MPSAITFSEGVEDRKRERFVIASALLAIVFASTYAFWSGLEFMVQKWSTPEYGHGYFIPFISLYLILRQRPALQRLEFSGSWAGPAVVATGVLIGVIGEFSTIVTIVQYGFFVTVFGAALAYFGWRGFRYVWVPLLYLVFMVPLPEFLYQRLSGEMQLISSSMGVWFIRLVDIPVFLSGNVIDLGSYKLQVVEACSGLRYLFPLMSFGFLLAYLYKGPIWHKVVLLLSTLPITIVMNSLRIALIGMFLEAWGVQMAENVLHFVQGWVVFIVCVAILFAEIWCLARLTGNRRASRDWFQSLGSWRTLSFGRFPRPRHSGPLLACLVVTLTAAGGSATLAARTEIVPPHAVLSTFPLRVGEWQGRRDRLPTDIIRALNFEDYVLADYGRVSDPTRVNYYAAFYGSQRKGEAVHSPSACIPGGGWRIEKMDVVSVPNVGVDGASLAVNRIVIRRGDIAQLVYYWFEQRGRALTNEFEVKWYIFWDGLTRKRTDGALVRLVTQITDERRSEEADQRLTDFLRTVYPMIGRYVPS